MSWTRHGTLILVLTLAACSPSPAPRQEAMTPARTPAQNPEPDCSPARIAVTRVDAGFERACKGEGCTILKGVTTVKNDCPHPVGVEFQVTLKSESGAALATTTLWLNSTRNLPVGESVLSLDHAIEYRPGAAVVSVAPVRTKVW